MEYTNFYLSFVFVYSTFSVNKGISMDAKQKKWSKVGRIIVASTAAYKSHHGLKICQVYKASTASSMEPLRALFLGNARGLTVPQTSATLTTTCSPKQRVLVSHSLVYYTNFSKKDRCNWKIRADCKNNVIRQLSALVNTLDFRKNILLDFLREIMLIVTLKLQF